MDDRREHGPFDIIGDIHGCYEELCELLIRLDYKFVLDNTDCLSVSHPQKRKAIFLGDLVDRGPKTPARFALSNADGK